MVVFKETLTYLRLQLSDRRVPENLLLLSLSLASLCLERPIPVLGALTAFVKVTYCVLV